MSDVTYVHGTIEYLIIEVDWSAPGETFTAADWTAEVALCAVGTAFDAGSATWQPANLSLVGTVNYVEVLIGSTLDPSPGTYKAFVKLNKTAGATEYPIIRALGKITVTDG